MEAKKPPRVVAQVSDFSGLFGFTRSFGCDGISSTAAPEEEQQPTISPQQQTQQQSQQQTLQQSSRASLKSKDATRRSFPSEQSSSRVSSKKSTQKQNRHPHPQTQISSLPFPFTALSRASSQHRQSLTFTTLACLHYGLPPLWLEP